MKIFVFGMGCCQSVEQNSVAMIEQFGRFDRMGTTGFNCLNPCRGEVFSRFIQFLFPVQ